MKKTFTAIAASLLLATSSQAASVTLGFGQAFQSVNDSGPDNLTTTAFFNPEEIKVPFSGLSASVTVFNGTTGTAAFATNALMCLFAAGNQGACKFSTSFTQNVVVNSITSKMSTDQSGVIVQYSLDDAPFFTSLGGQQAGTFDVLATGINLPAKSGQKLSFGIFGPPNMDSLLKDISISFLAVPEPGVTLLVGLALGLLALTRSKRRHH